MATFMVQGKITDLREVNLKGVPDSHRLAKLETVNGRTVIIDLGTGKELNDIKLQKNEQIVVIGEAGRINGKPVLFADQIADIVTINRADVNRASRSNRSDRDDRSADRTRDRDRDSERTRNADARDRSDR